MTFSKFTSLLLTLTFIGCSAGVSEEKENLSSTSSRTNNLVLATLKIDSTQRLRESNTSLHTITAKSYTMKACFKERALGKKIQYRNFKMQSSDRPTEILKTDLEGCIFWEEFENIDYTRSRGLKEFNRKLSLEGTNLSYTLLFGIDPMADKLVRLDKSTNHSVQTLHKMDSNQVIDIAQIRSFFKTYTTPLYGSIPVVGFKANVITCLRVGATADRLQGELVEATLTNLESNEEQVIVQKTDNFGCVDLVFDSSFERYSMPRYKPYKLQFKALSDNFMGVQSEREICLNPWQANHLFGHDTRAGACPKNPIGSVPKLHFNDVRYMYLGNKDEGFKINQHLDMSLTKSFLIRLHPFIDQGHNFRTENHYVQLHSGRFKLNFLLLAPKGNHIEVNEENIDDWEVLSGDEQEVEVVNGIIKQRIDLPIRFENLAKAMHRTYGVIMMRPLKDSEFADLGGTVAAGPFDAYARHFGSVLPISQGIDNEYKSEKLAERFLEKFETMKRRASQKELTTNWKVSPYEAFVKIQNQTDDLKDLNILRSNAFSDLLRSNKDKHLKIDSSKFRNHKEEFTTNDFEQLFAGTTELKDKRKFCNLFFIKSYKKRNGEDQTVTNQEFRDCLFNPDKFFSFESYEHIINLEENASRDENRNFFSETDKINVNTGFCMSLNNSERFSTSHRLSVDIGPGFKVGMGDIFAMGGGAKYAYSMMWSKDESLAGTNRGCTTRTKHIEADKIALTFKAKTRRCVLVKSKVYENTYGAPIMHPNVMKAWKEDNPSKRGESKYSKDRYHICENKDKSRTLSESWYYIGEGHPSVHPLRDKWNFGENILHKMIRGESQFERWYNAMSDDTRSVFMVKKTNMEAPSRYFSSIFNFNGEDKTLLYDSAYPGSLRY